ncbi:hypothetical protein [Streptomyces blattellae]|uniref:hypothetical protein n=1 Tax=Streptomyces blattellae TaxID=2569855 RepID=UPI0012B7595D|nr:hypothetical protein [Streptomyces blattellae]
MPRSSLPPPPPPPHSRMWPDRAALLADRGRVLQELHRCSIGLQRVLLLWLLALSAIIGWALLVVPLQQFEERDPLRFLLGPVFTLLGLAALSPSVITLGHAIRRDHLIRQLLDAWLELDSDPATDAGLRSPGLSLFWFLSSVVLCVTGLWVSFASVIGADPDRARHSDVALDMGIGTILWLTGLIGVVKAVRHYRWAVRALGPAPRPGAR